MWEARLDEPGFSFLWRSPSRARRPRPDGPSRSRRPVHRGARASGETGACRRGSGNQALDVATCHKSRRRSSSPRRDCAARRPLGNRVAICRIGELGRQHRVAISQTRRPSHEIVSRFSTRFGPTDEIASRSARHAAPGAKSRRRAAGSEVGRLGCTRRLRPKQGRAGVRSPSPKGDATPTSTKAPATDLSINSAVGPRPRAWAR